MGHHPSGRWEFVSEKGTKGKGKGQNCDIGIIIESICVTPPLGKVVASCNLILLPPFLTRRMIILIWS